MKKCITAADAIITASVPIKRRKESVFDIEAAIYTIRLIYHETKADALTVFNSLTKIMSVEDALNTVIEMRKKYLDKKNFKPYIDSDGRYRCYVYWEEDGKKKRKPLAAQNLQDLEKKALDFYEANTEANIPTLENLFPKFIKERIDDGVNDGTIAHDQNDWARYLQGDPITQRALADLPYSEFCSWFKRKLKGGCKNRRTGEIKPFTTKQAKCMRSLLSSLFQFAVDRELMNENYSSKLGRFSYKKYCVDPYKPDCDQVYQDDEPTRIMELAFNKYYERHNFAYLAVILNFLLDLRVGELVALKFSDLDDKPGEIHIQRQQIDNFITDPKTGQKRHHGFKVAEHTKCWERRFVNLSEIAENLIKFIKSEHIRLGIDSEYIFVNNRRVRMNSNSVTKVLYEVLNPGIDTSQKSCHKIRKTVTSNVRNELGIAVAARLAGHKHESTTDKHYCFSTTTNTACREEYTRVIDEKVPDQIKEFLVCSN